MWALIHNGTVAEITDINPAGRFHSSIQWVECGADTQPGWYYDGEQCVPPPPAPLADIAARKRAEIDNARDAAFSAGLEYEIAGEPDIVQTRPQDQINLLGLSAKAELLIADGVTDPIMPFRGLSNITRSLTPEQMSELALAALAHIEGIYQRSWERKDSIDAILADENLSDEEKREAIEAVGW